MSSAFHPVLSCAEAKQFEADLFGGEEERAWLAMVRAGQGVAASIEDDFGELGGLPDHARVLVLMGKGHNGGDALLAAAALAARRPGLTVDAWSVLGQRSLRPLAQRAARAFADALRGRERWVDASTVAPTYDLVIDGVFGFQYRPPLDARVLSALAMVNALAIRLRAAVDLPSGWDEPGAFRADFTYATGSVKAPLLGLAQAGRPRLVDLGFPTRAAFPQCRVWVAGPGVLAPLGRLRPAGSDKRSFGHLVVFGGSTRYPGAVLMSVLAALQSGVGLVTAFVPASLAPAFAARAPEAMWVGWPETPEGGLAMEGLHLWRERAGRASALLIGPGAGREAETLALLGDVVRSAAVPAVIDADALQPELVRDLPVASILTPHAGEFARIAGRQDLRTFSAGRSGVTVLKGPLTQIDDGQEVVLSFAGGPVLARGGSGDLLAGLIGGLLAQTPADPKGAAIRGVVWHGRAADQLARSRGAVAVRTTDLLDHLSTVINRLQ